MTLNNLWQILHYLVALARSSFLHPAWTVVHFPVRMEIPISAITVWSTMKVGSQCSIASLIRNDSSFGPHRSQEEQYFANRSYLFCIGTNRDQEGPRRTHGYYGSSWLACSKPFGIFGLPFLIIPWSTLLLPSARWFQCLP